MLEKEAKRRGFELKDLFRPEWLKELYKKFTLQSPEDMYAAVGYGGITTSQILHRLIDEYRKVNRQEDETQKTHRQRERRVRQAA